MNWNYENWLTEKLTLIARELSLDFDIECYTEQIFIKNKDFKANTIYVVIKYLSASLSTEGTTQPFQLIILSEENTLEGARALFEKFTIDYNWAISIQDTTYVKHQYIPPVVLSNFEETGIGYRSSLYVSGTLQIMENIIDVKNLQIDLDSIPFLSFGLTYQMTGNTQQLTQSEIASTVKSISTIAISLTLPLKGNIEVITKMLEVITGNASGNTDFAVRFTIGDITFDSVMKIINGVLTTAPNNTPALQIGLQV